MTSLSHPLSATSTEVRSGRSAGSRDIRADVNQAQTAACPVVLLRAQLPPLDMHRGRVGQADDHTLARLKSSDSLSPWLGTCLM